jgi:hypothetical protein
VGVRWVGVAGCVCGVCVCDFTRGSYVFPKKKKRKLINVSSQRCEHTPLNIILTKREDLARGLQSS